MLATALRRYGIDNLPLNKQGNPYRITHSHHPSTKWSGDSRSNFLWLIDYTEALYNRYKRSGGKAFTNVPDNLQRVREGALKLPEKGLTPFANCARAKDLGLDFTNIKDVHLAYQLYMCKRWEMDTIKLTWRGLSYE